MLLEEEADCTTGACVALALLEPRADALDLVELVRSRGVVRLLLLDRFGFAPEDAEESEDTGFGPCKFCCCLLGSGGFISFRGGRFLLAVGCSSFGALRDAGGITGAHEASELMGCFIHVATVEESNSSLCFDCLLLDLRIDSPRFDRLLRRAKAVDGGTMASKPDDAPSSLKATHSLLMLLATIFVRVLHFTKKSMNRQSTVGTTVTGRRRKGDGDSCWSCSKSQGCRLRRWLFERETTQNLKAIEYFVDGLIQKVRNSFSEATARRAI